MLNKHGDLTEAMEFRAGDRVRVSTLDQIFEMGIDSSLKSSINMLSVNQGLRFRAAGGDGMTGRGR